jgi:prevent-host-death family protein
MDRKPAAELGIRDLRLNLADVLNDTAVRGRIAYITSRGRRIAAIVPVPVAEAAERGEENLA